MVLKNILLIILGFLALTVGAVGVFLPILPTTPFFLVAAGCFSGGSPRLYKWLAQTRYFGAFIVNYRTKAGVSAAIKHRALMFLWIALTASALMFRQPYLCIILFLVGVGISVHIKFIKTKKE